MERYEKEVRYLKDPSRGRSWVSQHKTSIIKVKVFDILRRVDLPRFVNIDEGKCRCSSRTTEKFLLGKK